MIAITLSRRNFREYDQIVSLYTLNLGKVELLARGVKKITSKNSPHLEPFSIVEIEIIKGKEIDHLTKVQPIRYFSNIRKNREKSLAANYIVSLLDKLTQTGEKDENFFELLLSWLKYIDSTEKYNFFLIDAYIVKLLNCLGFDITYANNIPSNSIKQNLQILNQADWPQINRLIISDDDYNKINKFIYEYLVFHSEKKLDNWSQYKNRF
ncbi:MAG: DNA repair protein RecO [Candidatus Magasanikbacteria bacterium]|nr:DNA repair protein RecO [Candidatus Magasanikbacteria bacterium]